MSVPVVDAWLDEDGLHVWTKHPCVDGIVTAMLPHPHWSVEAHGNVRPSVHCLACGAHQFVNVTQGRWWPDQDTDL